MAKTLVAVHAHPDDESITMGGTLARFAAAGDRVVVITATLGEEGEVIGPQLQGLVSAAAGQLGGYRHWELQRALAALGVGEHHYLGGIGHFRDSGMVGTPPAGHPRAFLNARAGGHRHAEAVDLLAALLTQIQPDVVLTYDADGGYGHPDHVATHDVTVAAARRSGIGPVLAVVKPAAVLQAALADLVAVEGHPRATTADVGFLAPNFDATVDATVDAYTGFGTTVTIDVSAFGGQRAAALTAHATQVEVFGPNRFALSNRWLQPLLPAEYYRVVVPGTGAATLHRSGFWTSS